MTLIYIIGFWNDSLMYASALGSLWSCFSWFGFMPIASTPPTPDLVLIFHPNSKNTLFLLFPSSPSTRSPKLRENSTLKFLCLEGSTFYQQSTMFFPRVKGCLAIFGKFIFFVDSLTHLIITSQLHGSHS